MFKLASSRTMVAFRAAATYLVVAVLLVCPYLCFAGASVSCRPTAGCNEADDDDSCCDCCCGGPSADHSKGQPGQPDSRQAGGTCLCHGAVMEPAPSLPNPIQVSLTLYSPYVAVPLGDVSLWADRSPLPQAACHFAAVESGRILRALIESFLL
jgi:hypothetical protein